jgi:hypothetical protein
MTKDPTKRCSECREIAVCGVRTPMHCELHAHPEETALLGDDGLCSYCDPDVFRRVRLAKQREIRVALDRTAHADYALYDEKIGTGECGKERPDFAWDCGTHWVVLEVREEMDRMPHQYKMVLPVLDLGRVE